MFIFFFFLNYFYFIKIFLRLFSIRLRMTAWNYNREIDSNELYAYDFRTNTVVDPHTIYYDALIWSSRDTRLIMNIITVTWMDTIF